MAVTYGFFNSVNGDRKYNADQMSEYFRGIVSQGVFQNLDSGMAVSAGTGLSVSVAAGRAIIQNRWVQNSAALNLTISDASETYGRKDAVVIRLNKSSRAISIAVKTGTPAASPVAPSMTRDETTYEMALAYVNVAAGASSVTVTDKRSDSSVCGWASVAQATSGEVDQMLNDMKTGFDGVVYPSPAAMVQGEDQKLQNQITKASGLTPIVMDGTNQYINTNIAVGSTVSITPQTSTNFKYKIIPCSIGNKFLINATGGGAPRVWAFTDSEYKLISKDPTANHTVENLVLTAPEGSAFLIINDKSASVSYSGVDRMTKAENDIISTNQKLNLYTGGPFVEIPANASLNSYTTIGNYWCSESNAASVTDVPYSINQAFNLIVKSSFDDNTSYITQYLIPRTVTGSGLNAAVRVGRSSGTWYSWKLFAFTDVASIDKDGLMSKWDKRKINADQTYDVFEKELYPSTDSKMSNLLKIEKVICTFHDNFYRADNATNIGYNGSGSKKYQYSDMAPYTDETQNIQVGISGHKAVASNPYSVSGDVIRIKYKNVGNSMPYKVIMSFNGKGVVAISPIDTNNYLYVAATSNSFSVGGVGSFDMTPVEVTHNLNLNTIVLYVYHDSIHVYVAGQRFANVEVSLQNLLVGLLFKASEINDIAYTNFDVFNPNSNRYAYQDEGIEQALTFNNAIVNNSATADYSYGILLDTTVTKNSNKSIRFEQRKEDSSSVYRSEITVKNPRGNTPYDNYPLQTKMFEFDLYIPEDYGYDTQAEILWQMHHTPDGVVADGLIPNIAFSTVNGEFHLAVRSFDFKAQSSEEITHSNTYILGDYTPGTWYHFMVFIREGYLPEHDPCTAIWMNGELVHYSRETNGYNTTSGSYLKMGVYKPSYVHAEDTGTTKRVIYIDNLYVWM